MTFEPKDSETENEATGAQDAAGKRGRAGPIPTARLARDLEVQLAAAFASLPRSSNARGEYAKKIEAYLKDLDLSKYIPDIAARLARADIDRRSSGFLISDDSPSAEMWGEEYANAKVIKLGQGQFVRLADATFAHLQVMLLHQAEAMKKSADKNYADTVRVKYVSEFLASNPTNTYRDAMYKFGEWKRATK